MSVPVLVSPCWLASAARASPKSATLIWPSWVMRTFSGFMSRCTMPAWWAAPSPARIGTMMRSASAGENRVRAFNAARSVWPATYSIAKYTCPWSLPWS